MKCSFCLEIWSWKEIPDITTSLEHFTRVLVSARKQEKEIKAVRIGRKKNKTIIIHRIFSEIFKITNKLLELVHKFTKSLDTQSILEISTAFLQPQKDNKKIYNSIKNNQISMKKSNIRWYKISRQKAIQKIEGNERRPK